jgi:hypothetical protein
LTWFLEGESSSLPFFLLVPQRLDGVEFGGAHGRINEEGKSFYDTIMETEREEAAMLDIAPLLQGTWSEVLGHQDEIPATQRVIVMPDPSPDVEDEAEQERLQKVLEELFEEADRMDFTHPEGPPSPATEAIVEKFRRKGLRA